MEEDFQKIAALILGFNTYHLGKLFFAQLDQTSKLETLLICEQEIISGRALIEDNAHAKLIEAEKVYGCNFIAPIDCTCLVFAADDGYDFQTICFYVNEPEANIEKLEFRTYESASYTKQQFDDFKKSIVSVLIHRLTA